MGDGSGGGGSGSGSDAAAPGTDTGLGTGFGAEADAAAAAAAVSGLASGLGSLGDPGGFGGVGTATGGPASNGFGGFGGVSGVPGEAPSDTGAPGVGVGNLGGLGVGDAPSAGSTGGIGGFGGFGAPGGFGNTGISAPSDAGFGNIAGIGPSAAGFGLGPSDSLGISSNATQAALSTDVGAALGTLAAPDPTSSVAQASPTNQGIPAAPDFGQTFGEFGNPSVANPAVSAITAAMNDSLGTQAPAQAPPSVGISLPSTSMDAELGIAEPDAQIANVPASLSIPGAIAAPVGYGLQASPTTSVPSQEALAENPDLSEPVDATSTQAKDQSPQAQIAAINAQSLAAQAIPAAQNALSISQSQAPLSTVGVDSFSQNTPPSNIGPANFSLADALSQDTSAASSLTGQPGAGVGIASDAIAAPSQPGLASQSIPSSFADQGTQGASALAAALSALGISVPGTSGIGSDAIAAPGQPGITSSPAVSMGFQGFSPNQDSTENTQTPPGVASSPVSTPDTGFSIGQPSTAAGSQGDSGPSGGGGSGEGSFGFSPDTQDATNQTQASSTPPAVTTPTGITSPPIANTFTNQTPPVTTPAPQPGQVNPAGGPGNPTIGNQYEFANLLARYPDLRNALIQWSRGVQT